MAFSRLLFYLFYRRPIIGWNLCKKFLNDQISLSMLFPHMRTDLSGVASRTGEANKFFRFRNFNFIGNLFLPLPGGGRLGWGWKAYRLSNRRFLNGYSHPLPSPLPPDGRGDRLLKPITSPLYQAVLETFLPVWTLCLKNRLNYFSDRPMPVWKTICVLYR